MKKLIEVLQDDNGELYFYTDVDVMKDSSVVHETTMYAMLSMSTKLWGGNELSVLAILRALSIADLSISINRKDMIKNLDFASDHYGKVFQQTRDELVKQGKITVFAPGEKKPKMKN